MDNSRLIERLKHIKERMQRASVRVKRDLKTGAIIAAVGTVTSVAPSSKAAQPSARETSADRDAIAMTLNRPASRLLPEDITTHRTMVNISANTQKIIEFQNKALNKSGDEIKDFDNATKYSIWDVTFKREVGTMSNPVGVYKEYAGSLQFDNFNARNLAIYALINKDYQNIADKFFNKKDNPQGFKNALSAFQKEYNAKGNLAFHSGNAYRSKLSAFIVSDFKKRFAQEGEENPYQFLDLQREYASDCYASFGKADFDEILATLHKKNIEIDDVSWPIIGMWCSKQIATGNFKGIAKMLEGKTLDYINSPDYVKDLSNRFPSVFKDEGGKMAVKFALEHLNEGHSLTTIKEVSQIARRPDIYQNYLNLLRFTSPKAKRTYAQAKELHKNQKRIFEKACVERL